MTQTTTQKHKSRPRKTSIAPHPLKLWQDTAHSQEIRVEIIPLIDVIFCILIFFILAAVAFSRQQAISLDLPKASTGTPQMRDDKLIVTLDDLGQVYIENQMVTRNQLFDAIQNYHKFNPNGLTVLYATRNASYNEVIQVLDMLRKVGGDRVALGTVPGESTSPDSLPPELNGMPLTPGTNLPGNSFNPAAPNLPSNSYPGLGNPGLNPSNPVPSVPPAPNTNSAPPSQNPLLPGSSSGAGNRQ
jgi:biopolymer transport protein ExbD